MLQIAFFTRLGNKLKRQNTIIIKHPPLELVTKKPVTDAPKDKHKNKILFLHIIAPEIIIGTKNLIATLGLLKGAIEGKAENYKTALQVLGELQEESNETPTVNINIVDNSSLEGAMYEDNNRP